MLLVCTEFLNQCALTFRSLDTRGLGRVSRPLFRTNLLEVLHKKMSECTCPAIQTVLDAIGDHDDETIMFNTFCVDLFNHKDVYDVLKQPSEKTNINRAISLGKTNFTI